jgi:hypothetical protein
MLLDWRIHEILVYTEFWGENLAESGNLEDGKETDVGLSGLYKLFFPAHSGLWPLLQFRNLFYTYGRTYWTSDQPVARPIPKDSTSRFQRPSERRQYMS